jgi:hypothetical protein
MSINRVVPAGIILSSQHFDPETIYIIFLRYVVTSETNE